MGERGQGGRVSREGEEGAGQGEDVNYAGGKEWDSCCWAWVHGGMMWWSTLTQWIG